MLPACEGRTGCGPKAYRAIPANSFQTGFARVTALTSPPAPRRDAAPCPVHAALGQLGSAWAGPVIGRLARGAARFGQLRGALARPDGTGVSAKVLTAELTRLAEAGVVERIPRGAGVSYRLSDKGRALVPLLDALAGWAGADPIS